MRAQVGIEYMFIFGFSLLVVGLLWLYANSNVENTSWDVQLAYAKSALDNIVEVANTVYVQGPPSQVTIYPNFPDNVEAVYFANTTITLELLWQGNTLRNISASGIANLTGSLSASPGQHKIMVRALSTGINLTEA